MKDAESWINQLNLTAHPEGGYFRETYRSDESIPKDSLPARYDDDRKYVTQILFLLKSCDFSSFHKLESDETWHFIYGNPLEIIEILPSGHLRKTLLGHNIFDGQSLQYTVKRGNWFAARPLENNGFTVCACSVAPGFEFTDFFLARKEQLLELFPQHQNIIFQLTR
ncbi:MAG: hypothetical protein SCALA702_29170 [Melioribacteraceae bacterium]|nr:MAG: hypothetical protein SCALA702_29170 [Melioribacteraceae bacterium]